jgi:hypothetical protein
LKHCWWRWRSSSNFNNDNGLAHRQPVVLSLMKGNFNDALLSAAYARFLTLGLTQLVDSK